MYMEHTVTTFVLYLVFALAMLGLLYTKFAIFSAKKFMGDTALRYGFGYTDTASMETVSGSFFPCGKDDRITEVISGNRGGHDIRIYNYGKMDVANNYVIYTVYEYSYPYGLPHIILNHIHSMITYVDREDPNIKNGAMLTLEGNFSKKYKLQTEKFFEIEAYQIFNPIVMQMFLEQKHEIDLEVYDHKLYLFRDNIIRDRSEMDEFIKLGDKFNEMLEPHFKSVSASTVAMKERKNRH